MKRTWGLVALVLGFIALSGLGLAATNGFNAVTILSKTLIRFEENINLQGFNITNASYVCLGGDCKSAWSAISGGSNSSAWGNLTGFPADCTAGKFVSGIGPTLVCGTPTFNFDKTNIAYVNQTNAFTGTNSFSGTTTFSGGISGTPMSDSTVLFSDMGGVTAISLGTGRTELAPQMMRQLVNLTLMTQVRIASVVYTEGGLNNVLNVSLEYSTLTNCTAGAWTDLNAQLQALPIGTGVANANATYGTIPPAGRTSVCVRAVFNADGLINPVIYKVAAEFTS